MTWETMNSRQRAAAEIANELGACSIDLTGNLLTAIFDTMQAGEAAYVKIWRTLGVPVRAMLGITRSIVKVEFR